MSDVLRNVYMKTPILVQRTTQNSRGIFIVYKYYNAGLLYCWYMGRRQKIFFSIYKILYNREYDIVVRERSTTDCCDDEIIWNGSIII